VVSCNGFGHVGNGQRRRFEGNYVCEYVGSCAADSLGEYVGSRAADSLEEHVGPGATHTLELESGNSR
jgi:hypothetical protein